MQLSDAQAAEFERDGYLLVPGAFSGPEIELLLEGLGRMSRRRGPEVLREPGGGGAIKIIFGVDQHEEAYRRLTRHPYLLAGAERLLGERVCVYQVRVNCNSGFAGGGWGWHQDFNQWHRLDGLQEPRALLAAVFLHEVNACNAPLMVIPRSHRRGHIPVPDRMEIDEQVIAKLVAEGGIEALTAPAGSVVFLDCNAVHGSTSNISPWPRSIFYLIYNAVSNRTIIHPRGDYRCGLDFTPLEPLAENCLRELASGRR